jgi:CspA family cold shock protein
MHENVARDRGRLVVIEKAGASAGKFAIFVTSTSLLYWRLAAKTRKIRPRSSFWPAFQLVARSTGLRFKSFTILRLFVSAPDSCAAFVMEAKMAIGTVKFFDAGKGFGFIQQESGDKDVFVHVSAVQAAGMDTLSDGQRISYDVITERGKLAASNLKAA